MLELSAADRFYFERTLVAEGKQCIAGVDEAGRGPLAGPVVIASVILPSSWITGRMPEEFYELNDSKVLTERRREIFFARLSGCPEVTKAIVSVHSEEIDRLNILRATHQGMVRSLSQLGAAVTHVLVDGLPVNAIEIEQTALVKGDSRSYSIAAAGILAKVTRDRIMREYDDEFPGYGFAQHKGYPTKAHIEVLRRLGPCRIHRRSFGPVRTRQVELL
ncbi:MAG: Ribonuclease HII [Verrucomicrobia subdivision 3 bacterium]|nr:Ribonuclease HII [Limisphaerales bacterium]MCS1415293.1 Ribonuclease HII [Limisphaerales bacterium]